MRFKRGDLRRGIWYKGRPCIALEDMTSWGSVGLLVACGFGLSLVSAVAVVVLWLVATHTLPYSSRLPSHALITGGSKGLGLAIAKLLAQRGVSITIVARGQAALDKAVAEISSVAAASKTSSQTIQGFSADASKYEAILDMLKDVHESPAGPPGWVIANAGSASPGFILDGIPDLKLKTPGRMMSQMSSNYLPAVNLIQAVLSLANEGKTSLRDAKGSVIGLSPEALSRLPQKIVVVGSVLSMMSFIGYSAYAARCVLCIYF